MSFDFGPVISAISSSQESNLSDSELDGIVEESKATNTKRVTNWGMNKFLKWINKRSIVVDLKTVPEERLNEIMRKFYAEVKNEKKGALTPSALTGIRAAIHRALTSPPFERSINIINDRAFMTANQMFIARCKLYYKTNNKKPQHKAAIEQADMSLLKTYFGDPATDPVKLQEYVWFSLCFHFGRRGREGWRDLHKNHFVINCDAENKRYVTLAVTESTKNNPGGYKQRDQDYSDTRIYQLNNSALNPVLAYEKYVSKLNRDNVCLFQKPKKKFVFEEDTWYTKEVLGKNTLSGIMKCLSQKAGLSYMYTNHCVRASTVTTLYRAGIDTQQICATVDAPINGHSN